MLLQKYYHIVVVVAILIIISISLSLAEDALPEKLAVFLSLDTLHDGFRFNNLIDASTVLDQLHMLSHRRAG